MVQSIITTTIHVIITFVIEHAIFDMMLAMLLRIAVVPSPLLAVIIGNMILTIQQLLIKGSMTAVTDNSY